MKQTLPLQTRLATFKPHSADAEARTIEVVWSSGAAVKRYDWWADEEFYEQLDLQGANLDRLNSGAPVLNSHSSYSLNSVIGVVERAWIDGNEGRAQLRLSDRADVEPIWRDLQNGILRNISIGYSIDSMERVRSKDKGQPDVINVTAFTPAEISIVPVPADYRAQVRSESQVFPVAITEIPVAIEEVAAPVANPATPDPAIESAPAVDLNAVRQEAIAAERARIAEITRACKLAKLPDLAESLISDELSIDAARAKIIDAWAEQGGAEIRHAASVTPAEIDVVALQRKILNRLSGRME